VRSRERIFFFVALVLACCVGLAASNREAQSAQTASLAAESAYLFSYDEYMFRLRTAMGGLFSEAALKGLSSEGTPRDEADVALGLAEVLRRALADPSLEPPIRNVFEDIEAITDIEALVRRAELPLGTRPEDLDLQWLLRPLAEQWASVRNGGLRQTETTQQMRDVVLASDNEKEFLLRWFLFGPPPLVTTATATANDVSLANVIFLASSNIQLEVEQSTSQCQAAAQTIAERAGQLYVGLSPTARAELAKTQLLALQIPNELRMCLIASLMESVSTPPDGLATWLATLELESADLRREIEYLDRDVGDLKTSMSTQAADLVSRVSMVSSDIRRIVDSSALLDKRVQALETEMKAQEPRRDLSGWSMMLAVLALLVAAMAWRKNRSKRESTVT